MILICDVLQPDRVHSSTAELLSNKEPVTKRSDGNTETSGFSVSRL
jgi:hypothetical protein